MALASKLKLLLTELDCPFIRDVDESWILDLLLKPGEQRTRMFQWLLIKFEPSLTNILTTQNTVATGKLDSRQDKLLFVCSSMGLCGKEDMDLIKGTTSEDEQRCFITKLIEVVCVSQDVDICGYNLHGNAIGEVPIQENVNTAENYLERLLCDHSVEQVLSTGSHLPADITQAIERRKKSSRANQITWDTNRTSEALKSLKVQLQGQRMILEELQKTTQIECFDGERNRRICLSLQLDLQEFTQLVDALQICFDTELKHWCYKEMPRLSDLGSKCHQVHEMLTQFTKLLSQMRNLKSEVAVFRTGILDTLQAFSASQQQQMQSQSSANVTGDKFRLSLKECEHSIQVLEKSLNLFQELESTSESFDTQNSLQVFTR